MNFLGVAGVVPSVMLIELGCESVNECELKKSRKKKRKEKKRRKERKRSGRKSFLPSYRVGITQKKISLHSALFPGVTAPADTGSTSCDMGMAF